MAPWVLCWSTMNLECNSLWWFEVCMIQILNPKLFEVWILPISTAPWFPAIQWEEQRLWSDTSKSTFMGRILQLVQWPTIVGLRSISLIVLNCGLIGSTLASLDTCDSLCQIQIPVNQMQRTWWRIWRHLNPRDLCHSYPLTWYLPTRCLSTAERSKDSPPKSTHITPGCLIIKCLIHMWNCVLIPLKHEVRVCVQYKGTVSLSFSKNCFWTLGNGNNAPCTNAQNRAALADANPCFGKRSRHSMSMACTRGQHKAVVF